MNELGFEDLDRRASRAARLLSGYLAQTLSSEERKELDEWIGESPANKQMFEEVTDPKNIEKYSSIIRGMDHDKIRRAIETGKKVRPHSVISSVWTYLAAAVVIAIISLVYFFSSKTNEPQKVITENLPILILPGSDKAILTLSDGRKVILETVKKGVIAEDAGASMQKNEEGEIIYNASSGVAVATLTNTVTTPRGGQYRLILADGSKVWINSASSVTYPVSFGDSIRKVVITGEAYFEVAKNTAKPFIVQAGNTSIRVLGTHFNVNSYADELLARVTLSEGSVSVQNGNHSGKLIPGEQAAIDASGNIRTQKVDTDLYTAWKDGYFRWRNENITAIMRQVARWYDIDYTIDSSISRENFGGIVTRKDSIEKVLRIMESTSTIHFKTEGKRIIVTK